MPKIDSKHNFIFHCVIGLFWLRGKNLHTELWKNKDKSIEMELRFEILKEPCLTQVQHTLVDDGWGFCVLVPSLGISESYLNM